jgi:hypothetical protein
MEQFYSGNTRQSIARFLLLVTTLQISSPVTSWALTSGPTQPEFSGFESVSTKDMVNKFTGDFAYTLPLLEIPGPGGSSYPVTLGYRSGASAEDEASWVGYGWNLNPGTVNRGVRGIPDDFAGEEVVYTNKVPTNYTLTAQLSGGLEIFSGDLAKQFQIGGINASYAIRYNNANGFGYDRGVGISLGKGIISLGMNESDGRKTYSSRFNPVALLLSLKPDDHSDHTKGANYSPESAQAGKFLSTQSSATYLKNGALRALTGLTSTQIAGGNHGMLDYNEGSQPTMVSQYSGEAYNLYLGASVNPGPIPVGVNANISGSYTYRDALETDKVPAYGYLYSAAATTKRNSSSNFTGETNLLTDYYTEKDSPYNRRDVFIGVPFTNADSYNVSGEGIGGSFQLHHEKVGEFSPNSRRSTMKMYNRGADISIGWTIGAGANGSVGEQTLEQKPWSDGNLLNFSSLESGLSYFRFTNDMGGTAGSDLSNDAPVAASLNGRYDLVKNSLQLPSGNSNTQSPVRGGQGSHIGQHTVAEADRPAMYRYCKRADIYALRELPESGNVPATGSQNKVVQQGALAEFRVTNESGQQYTYGLPVYSRKETVMQYGVQGTPASDIYNNHLVYSDKEEVKVGTTRNGAYATSYLLTDITTPDYVDRNMNGPDANDFGNYTTFSYVKKYGGKGAQYPASWFRWRLPYSGQQYEPNSLSDSDDDLGAVSAGEKEICYLQAIHTKTHTAVFTISAQPRQDGYDAHPDEKQARKMPKAAGSAKLYKLDRIDLYANADVSQELFSNAPGEERMVWLPKQANGIKATPIKSIILNYDYSLCQKTPNSALTVGGTPGDGGKLTLLSITTAYNGVVTAKPYQFKYTYPDYTGSNAYPNKYANFATGYTYATSEQNPFYQQFCLDAWGDYQGNAVGEARHTNLQAWPDQRGLAATVDPAAWQLKRIILPSGGEIHVQYESDDYSYVQDQTVNALASMLPIPSNTPASERDRTFVVDPASVGIGQRPNSSRAELKTCLKLIRSQYVGTSKKIFFKFLYKLVSSQTPQSVRDCNTDYISGYATLQSADSCTVNGATKIKLVLAQSDWALPKQVCQDFVQTQRLGKLQDAGNCNPAIVGIDKREKDALKLFRQFASWISRVSVIPGGGPSADLCAALNLELSYFKIPLPISKRGGGLRVKRLLTYDKAQGLDDTPVLYGSEYEYQAYDKLTGTWRSSGVATTEPSTMREENALVAYMPRLQQGDIQKIVAGPDRKQSEGPLGESILPGASVGYSRVTVKNIHSGTTNPGYSVSEFYTCKDAPMQCYMSELTRRDDYRTLFTGFFNTSTNDSWATQGFSFVLNNMHGQPKREATYAGDYADINAQNKSGLVSEQIYQYEGFQNDAFNPGEGERITLQGEPEDAGTTYPLRQYPGKEVELTMAQHAIRDRTNDVSVEWDGQFTPIAILGIFWPTASLSISKNSADFHAHSTSKIIRYPAIVRQVVSMHDGMRDTTENLTFDRYTGSPVAVRTSDGGRGAYLKQNVMASWVYPQVQGKAFNEGLVLKKSNASNGWATLRPATGGELYLNSADCALLASVRKGDVLDLKQANNSTAVIYFADAPDIARKRIRLYPYFPSGTGNPISGNGDVTEVGVLFSGNSNELQMQVGSTTYNGSGRRNVSFKPVLPLAETRNGGQSTDPFAIALEQAVQRLASLTTGQNSAQVSFNLSSGTLFTDINVAGFAGRIAGSCQANMSHATVKDLMFIGYYDAPSSSVRVQLVSFKMQCAAASSTGGFITIN